MCVQGLAEAAICAGLVVWRGRAARWRRESEEMRESWECANGGQDDDAGFKDRIVDGCNK